jgi:predicted oxidoreductase
MARTIRTKCYLKEANTHNNSDYDKQIYKKNLTWHPPPAPLQIEDKLTEFEKALKKLHESINKKHKHRQLSNLNPLQLSALHQLCQNKNIIINQPTKI